MPILGKEQLRMIFQWKIAVHPILREKYIINCGLVYSVFKSKHVTNALDSWPGQLSKSFFLFQHI